MKSKTIIILTMPIILLLLNCKNANNERYFDPNDTRIRTILSSLKEIQKEIKNGNEEKIIDKYVQSKIRWHVEDCGNTTEDKVLDKDSKLTLAYIKSILLSNRFARIWVHSADSIRLSFWNGPKEKFAQQKISVFKDRSNSDIYNSVFKPESPEDDYNTDGGYSILIKIINKKMIIFRIELGYSC